jgi:hypothetical protein
MYERGNAVINDTTNAVRLAADQGSMLVDVVRTLRRPFGWYRYMADTGCAIALADVTSSELVLQLMIKKRCCCID